MKPNSLQKIACSILLAAGVFVTTQAVADCSATGCVAYVDQLYVEANGNLYVQTSGTETLANCTPDSGIHFLLPGTATKFKETYAMLLTAQALGWQVRIRIVDGSNPCTISWTAVDRQ